VGEKQPPVLRVGAPAKTGFSGVRILVYSKTKGTYYVCLATRSMGKLRGNEAIRLGGLTCVFQHGLFPYSNRVSGENRLAAINGAFGVCGLKRDISQTDYKPHVLRTKSPFQNRKRGKTPRSLKVRHVFIHGLEAVATLGTTQNANQSLTWNMVSAFAVCGVSS
jgi:hypothetical protein